MEKVVSIIVRLIFSRLKLWKYIPDRIYLRIIYYYKFHKALNLTEPKTYNEKLQWLKLNDKNPLYTKLVDKYAVKKIVAEMIGSKYVIPTIGIWDNVYDINWDSLPNQFVLKCTHDSGGIVICKDKSSLNIQEAYEKLDKSLHFNYYKVSREWPYKKVPRRVLCEPYIEDLSTKELRDYKFFCFNGVVKAMFIASERQTNKEPFFNFFDINFNELIFTQGHPRKIPAPAKPKRFEEMVEIAEKLSVGMPHVRIDLYEVNGQVLFGEYTFYHHGGFVPFVPSSWDTIFGNWISLI